MLFTLKITLVPLIILLVSLAGRRWGPVVSGLLGGMPIVVGPILFLLYLENGALFALDAAAGSLAGVTSLSCFAIAYRKISTRAGVAISLIGSACAILLATYIALTWPMPNGISFVVALSVIAFCYTRAVWPSAQLRTGHPVPSREIAFRMMAAVILVMLITLSSTILGPRLSGLLAPFPIAGTILAGFTHHYYGSDAAASLLRGFLRGLVGMATFDYALILGGGALGFNPAFMSALVLGFAAAAVVTFGCRRWESTRVTMAML